VPATGFSIGVSRLLAALEYLGKVNLTAERGPVVVAVFPDRNTEVVRENLASAQRMAQRLRDAGIRAEFYLGNPKNLGNQFKYADRRNSPCIVIQGPEEKAKRQVQIKDLLRGTEDAVFHDALGTSRKEYLEKRLAQFSISEDELVRAVRRLLEEHDKLVASPKA